MREFISTYNPGLPFSTDVIYSKLNEDPCKVIDDIAGTLEIIDGIEYLGSRIMTDESQIATRTKQGQQWISMEESRLNRIEIRFRITSTERDTGEIKSEEIVKEFLYPKLMGGFYFLLNGVRYFPIYQIVDSETFRSPTGVTLKTMIMPISLKHEQIDLSDTDGSSWSSRIFSIRVFEKTTNVLLYFLISKGFTETIEYFGYTHEDIGVCLVSETEGLEGYTYFTFSKGTVLYVRTELLETEQLSRDLAATLCNASGGKATVEKAHTEDHWKRAIGAMFTRNASALVEKAEKLSVSLERILDTRTKVVLRIPEEDKEDIYSIIRWMVRDYDVLYRQDNMDLAHKRVRLHEYLMYPLLNKWSEGVYRLLNSKQVSFSDHRTLFNSLGPGFLLNKLMNNDLLRYSGAVNGLDLFNCALKFSQRGPQSLASGSKNIAVRYRGLHPSYLGSIGLNTSSNGDPGLSGTFTPFIKLHPGGYFSASPLEEIAPEDLETIEALEAEDV